MKLENLLSMGYFPKELPPTFSTGSFAQFVGGLSESEPLIALEAGYDFVARPALYSLARGNIERRRLSVPNPVSQYLLSREISDNWQNIKSLVSSSKLSATAPTPNETEKGRSISTSSQLQHRHKLAMESRQNRRFILQTDITRFYHSIYTHSVPWAIHGKSTSKHNHKFKHTQTESLFGNRLDRYLQYSNDKQTIGIPIGPDTSLIISEIIMQQCDKRLSEKLKTLSGFRFIDDYELSFNTRAEAETAYTCLNEVLGDFELSLNPRKSQILELPVETQASWASTLRDFHFREKKNLQENDLYKYFDTLVGLHARHNHHSIPTFGIKRLRTPNIHVDNLATLEKILINIISFAPDAIEALLDCLIIHHNNGSPLSPSDEFSNMLNRLIAENAPNGRTSEVAWSLWACCVFRIRVSDSAVKALERCQDPFVAVLTLDCVNRGLISHKEALMSSYKSQLSDPKSLQSSAWILAYQVRQAFPKYWPTKNYIPPSFARMLDENVQFYDESKSEAFGDSLPELSEDLTLPSPTDVDSNPW